MLNIAGENTLVDMKKCFVCCGDATFYCKWQEFDYVKCNDCCLVYVDELPTEEQMYAAYDGGKWKSLKRKLVAPFRSIEKFKGYQERVSDFDVKLKQALPFFDNSLDKTLLDIGCNKGFFLVAAINNGFKVSGVELVPELTVQFKRKYKQFAKNIYAENISNVNKRFKEGEFSMITAFDVVEHLTNPIEDFQHLLRILKPGGIFLLQTPNTDSEESKKEKGNWGAIKAFEHYHLFNEKNLEQFAKKIGFTKVDFLDSKLCHGGDMLAILTK